MSLRSGQPLHSSRDRSSSGQYPFTVGFWTRPHPRLVGFALFAALGIPVLVALGVLLHPRWYPLNDAAQTEMRLRDVGTSHPPLVGFVGRLGSPSHLASHPGPLGFWLMWPVYRVFGETSWAMRAAAASVHLLAIAVILWISHRRAGMWLMAGMGAVVALLTRAYGASILTDSWNPYVPLLWWIVFLLATWSVISDDIVLLPIVVFAGSFCAQAHVGYVPLVAVLGASAVACSFRSAIVRRGEPRILSTWLRWAVIATVLAGVLWLPPLIEQVTRHPGNLTLLARTFRRPLEPPIGFGRAIRVLLIHLNPWTLGTSQLVRTLGPPSDANRGTAIGSVLPGFLLLVGWVLSALAAWRFRHRQLLRLHLLLAASLAVGAVAMSRISGLVWFYLVLWAWGITALMLLTVGWTALASAHRMAGHSGRVLAAVGRTSAVAAVVISTLLFALDASRIKTPDARASHAIGQVVAPTVAALSKSSVPGGGRRGRYLVTWGDPLYLGSQGWTLANELRRSGFEVGTLGIYHNAQMFYGRMSPRRATGVVHLSVGPDIRTWKLNRDAVQVAYFDPRDDQEVAEFRRLELTLIDGLRRKRLSRLVPLITNGSPLFVAFDRHVPGSLRSKALRMTNLGLPIAVFVVPPDAAGLSR